MQTQTFQVKGMTCGGCAASVTRAVKSVQGVDEARVALADGRVEVDYDPETASPTDVRAGVHAAIAAAGYEVVSNDAVTPQDKRGGCCCS